MDKTMTGITNVRLFLVTKNSNEIKNDLINQGIVSFEYQNYDLAVTGSRNVQTGHLSEKINNYKESVNDIIVSISPDD